MEQTPLVGFGLQDGDFENLFTLLDSDMRAMYNHISSIV